MADTSLVLQRLRDKPNQQLETRHVIGSFSERWKWLKMWSSESAASIEEVAGRTFKDEELCKVQGEMGRLIATISR